MKSLVISILPLAALLLAFSAASLHADDWTTTDGKVYQDVKVIHLEPDAVTILHRDGGALVPLACLPAELQKRFAYDPARAEAAADQRVKGDADSAKALLAEREEACRIHQAEEECPTDDLTAADPSCAAEAPVCSSTSHYSIDSIAGSAQTLRRDLSEPDYHTMAHLAYVVRTEGLGASSSSTHHTISEIADAGL